MISNCSVGSRIYCADRITNMPPVRNTRRTSGPATMSWNGSAMMMFFGILVSPDDEQLAPCAGFHAGFRPPYKDITNTIGTTMQQEIVITLRSVLLSGDTK